jgi:tetratricopeptide (TPR) repeat protein
MHSRLLLFTVALAAAVGFAPAQAGPAGCPGGDADHYSLIGQSALERGDWPHASEALGCAALLSTDPAIAERATRVAFENGQLGAAVRVAGRWLELQPEREEARRFLATSLLKQHRNDEAAAQFAILLDTAYDERPQGYLALLGSLSAEGNDNGAAAIMDRLAASDTDMAEAQYARSVLWQQAEHGGRALEAARRAVELKPGWRLAELAEVRALLLLGRTAEGLARAAALAADGDPLSQLNYAWLLAGAGREDDASNVFETLRREQVAVSQALEGLGSVKFAQRDYDSAARYFNELARSSRGDETALAYLGLIADRQGDPALAIRYLERVTTGPRAVASQLKAFELGTRLGAPERAELQLEDFLYQAPERARDVAIGRANQLADAGQTDAAVALMERLVGLYPDDDDLRLAQAFLLERTDQVQKAIAVMRGVLKRRPDDPTSLNSLGYTLVDRTRDVQEGYALILRALEGKPDSYAVMDSAGWALYRLKRNAQALEWLQRAWQRSPDPEVAAHLGEVLWAEGRQDEAKQLWQEALENSPENRSLQRTVARHPG